MTTTESSVIGKENISDKHKEVRDWLEKIYCDEVIPQYEINERTIEILLDLKRKNEEREREAEILIKDYEQKTEEYHAETEQLSKILQSVGLSTSNMSQSGNVSLRSLAMSAVALGIKDASLSSYYQALSKLATYSLDVEEMRIQDQKTVAKLFEKTKGALMKVETFKRTWEQVEEEAKTIPPEKDKKMQQSGFFQIKAKEYSKQMHQLKVDLEKHHVNPAIYHQNIVKLSEDLANLQKKIAPLKSKLDSYRNLPPNTSLARVKIEETRRELASVEAELSKSIDLMHL